VNRNTTVLDGRMVARDELRHTPAGAAALNFRIGHLSEQAEAGMNRKVNLEIDAVALGPVAEKLSRAAIEGEYRFEGFLALRSRQSRTPVLHVNSFELNRT
jgi:primosomal replication protein N